MRKTAQRYLRIQLRYAVAAAVVAKVDKPLCLGLDTKRAGRLHVVSHLTCHTVLTY